MLEDLTRRAGVAKRICRWSQERYVAFLESLPRELGRDRPRRLDPAEFGLNEEALASPGPDAGMTASERRGFGAYDAAKAVMAWRDDIWVPDGNEAARSYAFAYMDKADRDAAEMDEGSAVYDPEFPILGLIGCWPDRDYEGFLIREHRFAVEDGRCGYGDVILEKIHSPCVLVRTGQGVDIADGWHRTAAGLIVGSDTVAAIVVTVPEPGLTPGL